MIVQCDQCQAAYEVEESQVGDQGLAVVCTACQHSFRVVRKTFFVSAGLNAEEKVQAIEAPRAQLPGEAKASPPTPATEVAAVEPRVVERRSPSATPRPSMPRRRITDEGHEQQSSGSGWKTLFLMILATAGGVMWLRHAHPEYYRSARHEIDRQVDGLLSSVQGKKIVDPAAKQHYLKGRGEAAFDTQEHYLKAIAAYRKAIEVDPTYATAHGALSEAAAELAQIFTLQGNSQEAKTWSEETLSSATRGLTIDAQNVEAHRGLAAYERLQGQFVKAQEHLNEANLRDGNGVDTLVALARNYLNKAGLEDMAERYLNKALALDERSVRAHRYLAVTYERQNHLALAAEQWQKVLDLNQEHTLALQELERVRASIDKKAAPPVAVQPPAAVPAPKLAAKSQPVAPVPAPAEEPAEEPAAPAQTE